MASVSWLPRLDSDVSRPLASRNRSAALDCRPGRARRAVRLRRRTGAMLGAVAVVSAATPPPPERTELAARAYWKQFGVICLELERAVEQSGRALVDPGAAFYLSPVLVSGGGRVCAPREARCAPRASRSAGQRSSVSWGPARRCRKRRVRLRCNCSTSSRRRRCACRGIKAAPPPIERTDGSVRRRHRLCGPAEDGRERRQDDRRSRPRQRHAARQLSVLVAAQQLGRHRHDRVQRARPGHRGHDHQRRPRRRHARGPHRRRDPLPT